jgi:hypothetical protein
MMTNTVSPSAGVRGAAVPIGVLVAFARCGRCEHRGADAAADLALFMASPVFFHPRAERSWWPSSFWAAVGGRLGLRSPSGIMTDEITPATRVLAGKISRFL